MATDLGNVAALLSNCKRQFEHLQSNADREWELFCADASNLPLNVEFRVNFLVKDVEYLRECLMNWLQIYH